MYIQVSHQDRRHDHRADHGRQHLNDRGQFDGAKRGFGIPLEYWGGTPPPPAEADLGTPPPSDTQPPRYLEASRILVTGRAKH